MKLACVDIPSKFCLLLHVLSLLNETFPSKVQTSPIQVNNATVNRCSRGRSPYREEPYAATVKTRPVSHTVKNATDEARITLSVKKDSVCHRQTRRTTERGREQPSDDLNLKPEVSLTAEEVGVTGCKEGNCACTALPGRNTAASIASKTLDKSTMGTHSGLSPLEKPKLR